MIWTEYIREKKTSISSLSLLLLHLLPRTYMDFSCGFCGWMSLGCTIWIFFHCHLISIFQTCETSNRKWSALGAFCRQNRSVDMERIVSLIRADISPIGNAAWWSVRVELVAPGFLLQMNYARWYIWHDFASYWSQPRYPSELVVSFEKRSLISKLNILHSHRAIVTRVNFTEFCRRLEGEFGWLAV